jgi:CRP/FNR family transcriptional regulator, cyclic AMP receptor protein
VLESRLRLYKMLGCAKLTLDPSRVALLTISLLHHLVQENPEVGLRLAERLARRLYESREWIADVALKKVSARLASFLMRLLETEGMVGTAKVSAYARYIHEQFAAMIGARRVAVSRAMSELRRLGTVEVKDRRVYLRNEEALRRAAEIAPRKV